MEDNQNSSPPPENNAPQVPPVSSFPIVDTSQVVPLADIAGGNNGMNINRNNPLKE